MTTWEQNGVLIRIPCMTRKPRLHFPAATYHVMARGIDGRALFETDDEYRIFLRILEELQKELGFIVYAWCLMPNHIHLLIQVAAVRLELIMLRLLTRYSIGYNRRRGRRGYVFQDRYRAKLCATDSYFRTLLRYIHLNPAAAGLCRGPIDWPWSGHGELTGERPVRFVSRDSALARLGVPDEERVPAYRQLLEGTLDDWRRPPEDPDELAAAVVATGSKPDLDAMARDVAAQFGIWAAPTLLFFKDGQPVDKLQGVVPKPTLAQRVSALVGG